MKRIVVLSAVVLLVSGFSFAHANGGDKGKGKKSQTSCTKSCPGKECSKKKGS